MTGRHNTVGADLVNHCCDDILVMGARPLFFMDYLAYAEHDDALIQAVISGMTAACRENNCALLGGEMAEMTDLYAPGDYDLAGVIVGIVGENDILDGSRVKAGDKLLGLASTGLHTNGYTLARKLVFETAGLAPDDLLPGTDETVADALLKVHRSYAPSILPLLKTDAIHAMAHITGGGFPGNVDRTLPEHLDAVINIDAWDVPPLFRFLAETGNLTERDLYRTFNMGIGMVMSVPTDKAEEVAGSLRSSGETVYEIGRIEPGSHEVRLVHGI